VITEAKDTVDLDFLDLHPGGAVGGVYTRGAKGPASVGGGSGAMSVVTDEGVALQAAAQSTCTTVTAVVTAKAMPGALRVTEGLGHGGGCACEPGRPCSVAVLVMTKATIQVSTIY